MSNILFQNAQILDARQSDPMEGHVLIEDDRIKEISTTPIQTTSAQVIDLKGLYLMPGLIDAHVHVKASSLDFAQMARTQPSYLFAGAAQIMKGMLNRGFTTVRDACGADRGLADAVDEGLLASPRLKVCGLALSQTGGHSDTRSRNEWSAPAANEQYNALHPFGRIADGVDECRRAARDELRKGAHHVKIMAGGGVSSPSDPIENTQYCMDELEAICAEAAAWHTYAMAHTYTPDAISMAVRAGVRTVEHCNLIDKATAELVAEKGAFHVPTNITYWALNKHGAEFGFPQVSIDKLGMIVDAGLSSIEISQAAGVQIGFGTDLLGPCHLYQAHEFALTAEVLGNKGALATSLEVNPKIMGIPDIGRMEPGYIADVIVVRGNPMEDIHILESDGAQIPLVMQGGRIVKNQLHELVQSNASRKA
ncbi:MAG: amidohydrolase family protein [Paracoccaceae bacterium]